MAHAVTAPHSRFRRMTTFLIPLMSSPAISFLATGPDHSVCDLTSPCVLDGWTELDGGTDGWDVRLALISFAPETFSAYWEGMAGGFFEWERASVLIR